MVIKLFPPNDPVWNPEVSEQQDMYDSKWIIGNEYVIDYTIKKYMAREIWIYASSKGVSATYWPTTVNPEYLLTQRIEPFLPYRFDPQIR